MAIKPRPSYHVLAGVFTIVSASILIVISILRGFLWAGFGLPSWFFTYYLFSDAVNFAINVVGLIGGALSLMRKHYTLAVVGITTVLVESITYAEIYVAQPLFSQSIDRSIDFSGIIYPLGSLMALALSLVAILLIPKSKAEFS